MLLVPLALFVIWNLISFLWADSAFPAIYHGCLWLLYLFFFLLSLRLLGQAQPLRISLVGLAIVTSISAFLCSFFFLRAESKYAGLSEPLAITVPLFTSLALGARRSRHAMLWAIPSVLGWAAIVLSAKRASFLAALAGSLTLLLLIMLLPRFRRAASKRAGALLLMFLAASGLYLVSNQGASQLVGRLRSTGAQEQNTKVRMLLWKVGIEMFRASPAAGVGANNYEAAFPQARASLGEKNPDSPLLLLGEESLVQRAHNEFIQVLAELGIIGLLLLATFCSVLLLHAVRSLRSDRSPLAMGAVASVVAFAVSSSVSSYSFRWAGSGLLFFYAAALISRTSKPTPEPPDALGFNALSEQRIGAGMLILSLTLVVVIGVHAVSVTIAGAAERSRDLDRRERLYQTALLLNPYNAAINFSHGLSLFGQGRAREAVPRLRYAVERGFNASACYAYLASAERQSGDFPAAEKTLAQAVRVYPKSVFLRVYHAATLVKLGEFAGAEKEFLTARLINSRMARGWWLLIDGGYAKASEAAMEDPNIAAPDELHPDNCLPTVTPGTPHPQGLLSP